MVFLKKKAIRYSAAALFFAFHLVLSSTAFAMGVDYDEKGGRAIPAHRVAVQSGKGDKASPKGTSLLFEFDESLQKWLSQVCPKGDSDFSTEPRLTLLIAWRGHLIPMANGRFDRNFPIPYVARVPPKTCEVDLTEVYGSSHYRNMMSKYEPEDEKDLSLIISCYIYISLKEGLKGEAPISHLSDKYWREWGFEPFKLTKADRGKTFVDIVLGRVRSISLTDTTGGISTRDGGSISLRSYIAIDNGVGRCIGAAHAGARAVVNTSSWRGEGLPSCHPETSSGSRRS